MSLTKEITTDSLYVKTRGIGIRGKYWWAPLLLLGLIILAGIAVFNNEESEQISTEEVETEKTIYRVEEVLLDLNTINESIHAKRVAEIENTSSHVEVEANEAELEESAEIKNMVESKESAVVIEETSSQKVIEEEKEQVVIAPSTLAMTDYILPEENSEERTELPTHIMLHFSSNAANNPQNPYIVDEVYNVFKNYGVATHYLIDRNGHIYRMAHEDRSAYHAGQGHLASFPEYSTRLNQYSIGIELLAIGTREEMIPIIGENAFNKIDPALQGYTEAQYSALNTLINDIVSRNPGVVRDRRHIIGHDEYLPGKTDPGVLFNWSKIGL